MAEARGSKGPMVNQQAEEILRRRGYAYTVLYGVRPEEIARPSEGTQVRDPEHQAPPANIRAYAAAMLAGAEFPAVVQDADGNLLDGNTRRAAAMEANKTLNVIRLQDRLGIAEQRLLQVALNIHGERLTKKETKEAITGVVLSGATIDPGAVAVSSGYPKQTVKRWIIAAQLQLRATNLGIPKLPNLNESAKVAIQRFKFDEHLGALLELASDAKLEVSEITALVKDLNPLEDSVAVEEALEKSRQVTFATRIRQRGSGLVSAPWNAYVKHLRAIEALKPEYAKSIHPSDLATTQTMLEGLVTTLRTTKSVVDDRIDENRRTDTGDAA